MRFCGRLAAILSITGSSRTLPAITLIGRRTMRGLFIMLSALLCMAFSTPKSAAEEVSLDYLGLELLGNLEVAGGKSLKSDGVVLLVHDTLGHDRMELMAALQDSLRDVGV